MTTTLLVLRGGIVLSDGTKAGEGALVIFERSGAGISFTADSDGKLLMMSGKPIEEVIVGSGPFVMNSEEEIPQAYQDVRSGRMGKL